MKAVLSLLLVLCGLGCSSQPKAVLFGPSRKMLADDYEDVLATWTRTDRLYEGLENRMFVTATLHAPEFRRAFAVAFPEIYGHGGNITRRELVDLTGDVEQYHNFLLSVYTPKDEWNDLAQKDSIWRLNLIGSDEVAVDPTSIVLVKADANLTAVYPFIGRFDKVYLVRFPLADAMERMVLSPESTRATLRVTSALGVAEMHWDLIPQATHSTPAATAP